jgi:hypothetical protein
MQKTVRELRIDDEGKQTRRGNPVKHNRGDLVLVDCNVTGSSYGTAAKPQFPLKALWENVLIPQLEALVAPGGAAEGAVVVHQEVDTMHVHNS